MLESQCQTDKSACKAFFSSDKGQYVDCTCSLKYLKWIWTQPLLEIRKGCCLTFIQWLTFGPKYTMHFCPCYRLWMEIFLWFLEKSWKAFEILSTVFSSTWLKWQHTFSDGIVTLMLKKANVGAQHGLFDLTKIPLWVETLFSGLVEISSTAQHVGSHPLIKHVHTLANTLFHPLQILYLGLVSAQTPLSFTHTSSSPPHWSLNICILVTALPPWMKL